MRGAGRTRARALGPRAELFGGASHQLAGVGRDMGLAAGAPGDGCDDTAVCAAMSRTVTRRPVGRLTIGYTAAFPAAA